VLSNDDAEENINNLLVAVKIERDEKIASALEIIRGAIEK
jgi:hypothetical protein